ncbi:hypothetical protein VPHD479_0166 [Vibrio phage D479]
MITIYVIQGCDSCRHAIALAEFKKVEHEVLTLASDSDVDQLRTRHDFKGQVHVPLVFNEKEYIGHIPEFKRWVDARYK